MFKRSSNDEMSGFTADRESPPVRGNLSSTEPGIPTYQSAGTNTRLVD
jgi:hypothetical protein